MYVQCSTAEQSQVWKTALWSFNGQIMKRTSEFSNMLHRRCASLENFLFIVSSSPRHIKHCDLLSTKLGNSSWDSVNKGPAESQRKSTVPLDLED